MGLLDLPSALVDWSDGAMAEAVPLPLRILIWGVISALLSMEIYRLLSPQHRIARIRRELRDAQQDMASYDGPAEGIWPLISKVLSLACRRLLLVFPATLVAAVPVLAVILWLDSAHAYRLPGPGEAFQVRASDPAYSGTLLPTGDVATPAKALLADSSGQPVARVPVARPVPVIHKHRPWNLLLGNPAGYLPENSPVDSISFDLPRLELFGFGPPWLRGWEPLFFFTVFAAALTLKLVRRIE